MTEPLWNHGDHGGATAVYAVQAPQWHRASGVTGVLHRGCPKVRSSVLVCSSITLITLPDGIGSTVRLFADDTVMYLTIASPTDSHKLQTYFGENMANAIPPR